MTCGDEFLVSVAEDASIIVWKILDRALIGQSKVEKPYTMEILVLPPDIEKKARNYSLLLLIKANYTIIIYLFLSSGN